MEKRSVGFWLGLGIVFMPYLFSWITLKEGFSWLSRITSLGWLAFLVVIAVQGNLEQQKKIEAEQQQIIELESKANAGDVGSLLQLATKFSSNSSGNKIENLEKATTYLKKAVNLGSSEAKQMLGLVENQLAEQKKNEELNRILNENKSKVVQYLKGDWIVRSQEIKTVMKISFNNSGELSVTAATEQEADPEKYKQSMQYQSEARYDKYKNILGQDGGIVDSIKEVASDKASDAADFATEKTMHGAAGIAFDWIIRNFSESNGYVNDLENETRYSELKIKYPASVFFKVVNEKATILFISDFQNSRDVLLKFECDNETCKKCNPYICPSADGDLTRLNPSDTRQIFQKTLLPVEATISPAPTQVVSTPSKSIGKTIEGVITEYGCGDNCYLTIVDNQKNELAGLCAAPLCQAWNEAVDMPAEFKGKKVRVTVENGIRYDGNGNPVDEMESFVEIKLLSNSKEAKPQQSTNSFINEMITSASFFDARAAAQKNLEALPKPPHGNKKEARKLNDQALALAKQSDYQAALPIMEAAYQADPADVEIAGNIGYLQIMLSNYPAAKKALFETLALKPDRSTAWADLGKVFTSEGNEESAKNCYINFYLSSKNQEAAGKHLTTAVSDNPVLTRVKQATYDEIMSWGTGD
jgi:hypothetical protein